MAATITPERPATESQLAGSQLRTLKRRRRFERAHVIAARVVLGGIMLQVFFAGLGIFTSTGFLPHMILGALLILSSFSVPVLASVGHLERSLVIRSWLLGGLMILQGLLIDASRVVPVIGALHPVNALLLVLVTFSLASRRLED